MMRKNGNPYHSTLPMAITLKAANNYVNNFVSPVSYVFNVGSSCAETNSLEFDFYSVKQTESLLDLVNNFSFWSRNQFNFVYSHINNLCMIWRENIMITWNPTNNVSMQTNHARTKLMSKPINLSTRLIWCYTFHGNSINCFKDSIVSHGKCVWSVSLKYLQESFQSLHFVYVRTLMDWCMFRIFYRSNGLISWNETSIITFFALTSKEKPLKYNRIYKNQQTAGSHYPPRWKSPHLLRKPYA